MVCIYYSVHLLFNDEALPSANGRIHRMHTTWYLYHLHVNKKTTRSVQKVLLEYHIVDYCSIISLMLQHWCSVFLYWSHFKYTSVDWRRKVSHLTQKTSLTLVKCVLEAGKERQTVWSQTSGQWEGVHVQARLLKFWDTDLNESLSYLSVTAFP